MLHFRVISIAFKTLRVKNIPKNMTECRKKKIRDENVAVGLSKPTVMSPRVIGFPSDDLCRVINRMTNDWSQVHNKSRGIWLIRTDIGRKVEHRPPNVICSLFLS